MLLSKLGLEVDGVHTRAHRHFFLSFPNNTRRLLAVLLEETEGLWALSSLLSPLVSRFEERERERKRERE